MAYPNTTPSAARLEEALTVLFCLIDDAYRPLNPGGSDAYGSLKRLSDSEVLTLALFQQLCGLESERSFLRDAERFFSYQIRLNSAALRAAVSLVLPISMAL